MARRRATRTALLSERNAGHAASRPRRAGGVGAGAIQRADDGRVPTDCPSRTKRRTRRGSSRSYNYAWGRRRPAAGSRRRSSLRAQFDARAAEALRQPRLPIGELGPRLPHIDQLRRRRRSTRACVPRRSNSSRACRTRSTPSSPRSRSTLACTLAQREGRVRRFVLSEAQGARRRLGGAAASTRAALEQRRGRPILYREALRCCSPRHEGGEVTEAAWPRPPSDAVATPLTPA